MRRYNHKRANALFAYTHKAYQLPAMDEFSLFTSKLQTCDLIVLTEADESRTYCRFYFNGLYQDRMFISDISVKESLNLLCSEEYVIDWNGIQDLRKKYCDVVEGKEGLGAIEQSLV
jgi:hypothetical protein